MLQLKAREKVIQFLSKHILKLKRKFPNIWVRTIFLHSKPPSTHFENFTYCFCRQNFNGRLHKASVNTQKLSTPTLQSCEGAKTKLVMNKERSLFPSKSQIPTRACAERLLSTAYSFTHGTWEVKIIVSAFDDTLWRVPF